MKKKTQNNLDFFFKVLKKCVLHKKIKLKIQSLISNPLR